MTDPHTIAKGLTKAQRDALFCVPGASRACLLKDGLAYWGSRPGYRFPTIKISSLGFAVRQALKKLKP